MLRPRLGRRSASFANLVGAIHDAEKYARRKTIFQVGVHRDFALGHFRDLRLADMGCASRGGLRGLLQLPGIYYRRGRVCGAWQYPLLFGVLRH